MSVSGKIKHFLKEQHDFDQFFREISANYRIPMSLVKLDSLLCRFVYGAPVSQYIGFNLYQKNRHERNCFVTDGRTKKLLKQLNGAPCEEEKTVDEKNVFNRVYCQFIKREWIYVPEASDAEIEAFLHKYERLIVKPTDLTKGEGVHKINSADALVNLPQFCADARRQRLLMEEIIVQHPMLQEVNPSSVNTIRIATVRDRQGIVHIFGASLRGGGAGSEVDNLHAGGAQYPIDIQTGLISSGGVTFDGKKSILYHPSTNKQMVGLRIPFWDQVLATVTEAAKIPEQLRYLGWDVAITENGCELIEANSSQGCNGMQLDGVGKYPYLKQFI